MKLRIKFRKYGAVRFIGHLDLMRFFQKMIRRADLDIAYSHGFSPHQIMSFAAPLGVGLESNGEYVDVEMNSITTSEDMIKRLNTASVDGVEILSIRMLPDDCKNAMASVAAASYTVSFREGYEPKVDYREELPVFIEATEIPYEKETKKSMLLLDLKPAIYDLSINENGSIYMLVNASSAGNIKPGMVLDAFLQKYGEKLPENALLITREDTYQLTEKAKKKPPEHLQKSDFVSMGEIGEIIG